MRKYTIKTIDGNRYENIRDNSKHYDPIDMQIWLKKNIITVEDMDGCIRHFVASNIIYIKEEPDGEETEEG